MMTEIELVAAIRDRISDPSLRVDMPWYVDPRWIVAPPIYATATDAAIDVAETELGFPLPMLLKRLYQEVGNGGFGPGAGILGVDGGYADYDALTLSSFYKTLSSQGWPNGLLMLCDIGCAAWLCIDGPTLSDQILIVDEPGITRTGFTLSTLLEAWVNDVNLSSELFEIGKELPGINPFTREPISFKSRGCARGVLIKSFPP